MADLGASEHANARVVELMRPAKDVVPVLGAGVSVSAGMPNGPDLGTELLRAFDIDPGDAALSLAAAVDRLLRQGVEEERMLRALAESLATRHPHPSPLTRP